MAAGGPLAGVGGPRYRAGTRRRPRAELAGVDQGQDAAFDLGGLREVANSGLRSDERRMRLLIMPNGMSATPEHPAAGYFQRRADRIVEIFTGLIARRQREGWPILG